MSTSTLPAVAEPLAEPDLLPPLAMAADEEPDLARQDRVDEA
jgi:hypothetical protein